MVGEGESNGVCRILMSAHIYRYTYADACRQIIFLFLSLYIFEFGFGNGLLTHSSATQREAEVRQLPMD